MCKKNSAFVSPWYAATKLGKTRLGFDCCSDTHCEYCAPTGDCHVCGTVDGRFVDAVSEYASTCDGHCMQLTLNALKQRDPVTQLAYCEKCIPKLPKEIRDILETDV